MSSPAAGRCHHPHRCPSMPANGVAQGGAQAAAPRHGRPPATSVVTQHFVVFAGMREYGGKGGVGGGCSRRTVLVVPGAAGSPLLVPRSVTAAARAAVTVVAVGSVGTAVNAAASAAADLVFGRAVCGSAQRGQRAESKVARRRSTVAGEPAHPPPQSSPLHRR